MELLQNQWIRMGLAGVLMAVLGAAITLVITSVGSGPAAAQAIVLTNGSTVQVSGSGQSRGAIGALGELYQESLPLMAADAVAAGWKDPFLCSPGRGRYFQRDQAGEGAPYILMYSSEDRLIGVYLYIMSEMPSPWKHMEQLRGGGGLPILDFEHWGTFVYIEEPTRACGVRGNYMQPVY